jgi:HD-GYP domain-containing protein (c-di-GMP phosphodiesterase class II)
MKFAIFNFFQPPTYHSFERTQRAKVLHVTLLVSVVGCILLGFQNLSLNTNLDTVLFAVSGICLLGVYLNKKGYYYTVATFITLMILALITYSLIVGVGLWDAAMIAYPFFILFASFLFSKKMSPVVTLLSAASVALVYYLDQQGLLDPANFYPGAQFVNIVILIFAVGFLMWTIMGNWEKSLANLQETYDLTLAGWAKALEYRDRETEGHSQRVTSLCTQLARRLGITGTELENVRRGALLHDIGKMAIPDAILLKEGSLTDADWEVVKMHPVYAKRFIAEIPFLVPALDIPYCHHERWDGSGYPQGLSGEEIPLAARIFAVIDVWDALLSDRPYRKAWPEEKVREYIQEQSGVLFDPKVVEAFFPLLSDLETNPDRVS